MRLLFFICIIFPTLANASGRIPPDKSILRQQYSILSDEVKPEIPADRVRVKGKVHYGEDLRGGTVSTLDRERVAKLDSAGNYEFYIRPTDTTIFFYKPGLDEIVIWNYHFQATHEVVIDFFPQSNLMIMEVDKPVIYLYSDQPTEVSLYPNFSGDLTFTYPLLNEGWKVEASNSGELKDVVNGNSYPYLFWDGQKENLNFVTNNGSASGFMIKTDSTISFLERTLTSLSLNSTESTDFITFWGPRIMQSDYAFVQFLVDEEYELISTNTIHPKPDVNRRVYMLFAGLDNPNNFPYSIKAQEFESVERKGLVLIEWGGSEIPLNLLKTL